MQIGVAGDAKTEDDLEKVFAGGVCAAGALGVGQSSLQLPVLILNLSDIFLLPVTWVLRRHAVALLLPRLLRLLRESKGRSLWLLNLQFHWNLLWLWAWVGDRSSGGSESGMRAFEFQFEFPCGCEDFPLALLGDAVILLEVVHDFSETSGAEAEVLSCFPHHLLSEAFSRAVLPAWHSREGIFNEVIHEAIVLVFT
jgi:hypothetical protein